MDGMQVPVPPGTKTGYSRASTRPTSATTTCSGSPRSRPQRPLSARSTGSRDARNSACYEADFATNSWSDWQSAPSRPTSAKSQAGQVASTPQTARRLSNASGYEMIPVRPDSARSTRTPEHHSLEEQIIASPDFGRRCVEEELSEPVLTRIPNSIATQLEKQGRNSYRTERQGTPCPKASSERCQLQTWQRLLLAMARPCCFGRDLGQQFGNSELS